MLSEKESYAVIKFVQDESLGVVPSKWLLDEKTTLWPNSTKISTSRMVMQYADAGDDWDKFPVRILHKYSNFNKANRACKVAEDKSEVDTAAGESDVAGKRRERRRPNRYDSGSDIDDPPSKKKKSHPLESEDEEDEENINEVRLAVKNLLTKNQKVVMKDNASNRNSFKEKPSKIKPPKEKPSKIKPPKEKPSKIKPNNHSKASDSPVGIMDSRKVVTSPAGNKGTDISWSPVSISSAGKVSPMSSVREGVSSPAMLQKHKVVCLQDQVDLPTVGREMEDDSHLPLKKKHVKQLFTTDDLEIAYSDTNTSDSNNTILVGAATKSASGSKGMSSSVETSHRAKHKAQTWQYEECNAKLDFIIARLELIQRLLKPEEESIQKPKGQPSFPLASEEAINATEEYLKSDVNFKLTMLYLQAHIDGAESIKKATHIILKKIFTNRLARIMSFGGTGGSKIALCNLTLLECILCAVKSVFKGGSMEKVKEFIQRWLQTANQRKMEATVVAA